ncbi:unnamed protein product [Timema podura]|uniref:Uncharacterized protein n=1 Tax=Timema podura TaxID=61482 RepID=A0ABN7NP82_TIMPD|nr:unnamed protein product [Timema podura]
MCFLVVSSAVAYSAFVVYQFATRDIQRVGSGGGEMATSPYLPSSRLPITALARGISARKAQSGLSTPLPPGDIGERGGRAGGRAHTQEGGQGRGRTSEDTPGAQHSSWMCILVVSRLTRGKPRWYSQIWEPHNTKSVYSSRCGQHATVTIVTGGWDIVLSQQY